MDNIACTGSCTVTLVVDSVPLTEEKANDLTVMFWGFVLAAVLVWGVRQILNLFTSDNES